MTTEYLYNQEVERVLAALMPQNRLIVRVMLHTGMRLSDALELRTEALALSGWYTEAKTGKKRRYGLPSPLLEEIRDQAGPEWAFPGRKRPPQDPAGRVAGYQTGGEGVPFAPERGKPFYAEGLCRASDAEVWQHRQG